MKDFNVVLYSIVGDRIRLRREELKLSQAQLSERVSVIHKLKRSSISNIERGRQQPPLHVLYEICNILDIDVQTILPTYSDVNAQVENSKKQGIESFINSFEIDDITREKISQILRKTDHET